MQAVAKSVGIDAETVNPHPTASSGSVAAGCRRPPLSPARVDNIRHRIRDGSYDHPDVVDAIARRVLGRGDL